LPGTSLEPGFLIRIPVPTRNNLQFTPRGTRIHIDTARSDALPQQLLFCGM
jgi:hypothetical protein